MIENAASPSAIALIVLVRGRHKFFWCPSYPPPPPPPPPPQEQHQSSNDQKCDFSIGCCPDITTWLTGPKRPSYLLTYSPSAIVFIRRRQSWYPYITTTHGPPEEQHPSLNGENCEFSISCSAGQRETWCHTHPRRTAPIINRRFPEITGEDNLTVFSYSGRVKSPEWRRQLRRADLRQF